MKHVLIFYLIELFVNINATIDASHDIRAIKKLLKKGDIITVEKHCNTNPKLLDDIKNYLQKKHEQNTQLQITLNTVKTLQENKKIKAKL